MRQVRPLWIGILLSAALAAAPVGTAAAMPDPSGLTLYNGAFYSTERVALSLYSNLSSGPPVDVTYRGVVFYVQLVGWGSPGGPSVVGEATEPGLVTLPFEVGGPSRCACWASADGYVGIEYYSNFHVLLMVGTMAPYLLGWMATVPLVLGTGGLVMGFVLLVREQRNRRRDSNALSAPNASTFERGEPPKPV